MARKVYIVNELNEQAISAAQALGISEIVVGIPPALAQIVTEAQLPHEYTEPEPAPSPKEQAKASELAALTTLLGLDWQASEDAWPGLTAAQRAEHLRVRSNATRRAILFIWRHIGDIAAQELQ